MVTEAPDLLAGYRYAFTAECSCGWRAGSHVSDVLHMGGALSAARADLKLHDVAGHSRGVGAARLSLKEDN